LKDEALGAAILIVSVFEKNGRQKDDSVNREVDTVVNVVLSWVHR
jgi:hypothetical protein